MQICVCFDILYRMKKQKVTPFCESLRVFEYNFFFFPFFTLTLVSSIQEEIANRVSFQVFSIAVI